MMNILSVKALSFSLLLTLLTLPNVLFARRRGDPPRCTVSFDLPMEKIPNCTLPSDPPGLYSSKVSTSFYFTTQLLPNACCVFEVSAYRSCDNVITRTELCDPIKPSPTLRRIGCPNHPNGPGETCYISSIHINPDRVDCYIIDDIVQIGTCSIQSCAS